MRLMSEAACVGERKAIHMFLKCMTLDGLQFMNLGDGKSAGTI